MRRGCRTHLILFIPWMCRYVRPFLLKPITNYSHVCEIVFKQKKIGEACCQNGPQTGKKFAYTKVTVLVLIFHIRGMFIGIFRRIYCNEE